LNGGYIMKKSMVAVLLLLFLFGTVSMLACASSKDTRENTFSVGSNPAVEVEVGNGNVDLVLGTTGQIIVVAELQKPESVKYEVSQDGDSIMVDAKTRDGSKADVTVTVPTNTEFILSTGNGDVSVVGVQGSGILNSGDGLMKLERVTGDIIGNVGNGDITVSDVAGSFILNDGNGNIILSDAKGSFILSLGNGDITFQGELSPSGNSALSVGNGAVTVELTRSPSVALDLEIEEEGKIRVGPPATVSEESDYHFIGTIGDGEAALKVRTGTGDITIK
jgi:hypothetical protein